MTDFEFSRFYYESIISDVLNEKTRDPTTHECFIDDIGIGRRKLREKTDPFIAFKTKNFTTDYKTLKDVDKQNAWRANLAEKQVEVERAANECLLAEKEPLAKVDITVKRNSFGEDKDVYVEVSKGKKYCT